MRTPHARIPNAHFFLTCARLLARAENAKLKAQLQAYEPERAALLARVAALERELEDVKANVNLKISLAKKEAALEAKDTAFQMFVQGLDRGMGQRAASTPSSGQGTPGASAKYLLCIKSRRC